MTPVQIEQVRSTWLQLAPIAGAAADLFYGKLFDLDPQLHRLFSEDLSRQKRRLLDVIGSAVTALDQPDALVPVVQALGRRHTDYGVRPQDYTTVGKALLWTLEQGLGEDWTVSVREAWTAVYTLLSETMLEASRKAA